MDSSLNLSCSSGRVVSDLKNLQKKNIPKQSHKPQNCLDLFLRQAISLYKWKHPVSKVAALYLYLVGGPQQ